MNWAAIRPARFFVAAINNIGHHPGMKSLAEYVQDREAADILREIGVDHAQGRFVGMPESEPEALKA